ncbi:MAG TPA: bifunctional riboflavin kinase/FAD synthetase [Geminicoccus sp.]|jgi:riboflavin kinase/FMN adenylyltransferase|uniref:bifunctional riboflavin kinase/FAD synthetase n=1 Tax=Geminicoccus sp. TaxID=2024832 RepID=UPI002E340FE7|nr:bifunctional riboflavin kinase/FAD synthetase [Geminicoccus sp.]HEX2526226.1 bifunctional riboflavin kinase/FAD synthetase [Geminicoccus sp.]
MAILDPPPPLAHLPGMQVHCHLDHLPKAARGLALAIGNFDGVHLGHRAILGRTAADARDLGVPAGVLTFEPHPRELFSPDSAPRRLTPLRRKLELLRDVGLMHVVVPRFTRAFATLAPEAFVDDVLIHRMGVRIVVVGADFCFGKGRAGTAQFLKERLATHGVAAVVHCKVSIDGVDCSSTRIRQFLADGDVRAAARLLGRPHVIEGVVRRGAGLGRQIGFPTANIAPLHRRVLLPAHGVYAARVGIVGEDPGEPRPAVLNWGRRPTVDGVQEVLEVHLFDLPRDLYGRRLRVGFVERLRGEIRFPNLEALVARIREDAEAARALLSSPPSSAGT